MSIKLKCEENHQHGEPDIMRVVFICDWCGKEIINDGLYLYSLLPFEDGLEKDFYTVHKGDCDRQFCTFNFPDEHIGNMDLHHLIIYLANNFGLNWIKMQ